MVVHIIKVRISIHIINVMFNDSPNRNLIDNPKALNLNTLHPIKED